ncbi:MAG: hypothetical protein R6U51_00240 [Anaerolineales bacterium]
MRQRLPTLSTGSLQLLVAPNPFRQQVVTHFIAELALKGPVQVLDGGNRFDVLRLNRELRRRGRDFYTPLKRIRVARAFTCYQMVTLLEKNSGKGTPTLVLNPLTTFEDESVPFPERLRLLETARYWLDKAARRAPVMLVLHPRPEGDPFLERLGQSADRVWTFEGPPSPTQLSYL